MKNFTSILIALLLITGCANAPKETSTKLTLGLVQSTVTKGANQSEITKTLGAPNIISKDRQGNVTWTYDRISRESTSGSSAGIGFGGLLDGFLEYPEAHHRQAHLQSQLQLLLLLMMIKV